MIALLRPGERTFCREQHTVKGDGTLFGKIRKVFCSVKTTVVILIAIALFSVIGTLLPQGHPEAAADSHSLVFSILKTLQFYDIFHSFWFVMLAFFLAMNLIFCTWYRLLSVSLPRSAKKHSESPKVPNPPAGEAINLVSNHSLAEEINHCETVLKKFSRTFSREDRKDETIFHGQKGLLSTYGVYLIHASILLILLGVVLDACFRVEGTMTIMEGESDRILYLAREKGVKKLDFTVRCDRFFLSRYDNGAPKMYRSDLTFLAGGKPVHRGAVLVNHPIAFGGLRFYQASYGAIPSAQVAILSPQEGKAKTSVEATKGIAYPLPDGGASFEVIRIEENFMNMGPAAKIRVHTPDGDLRFWIFQHIESLRETYPGVFDGMPVLNPAAFKPFVFALDGLHNRYYTGLQVMREPGVFWVGLGATLMITGFMMVFFYPRRQVWVAVRRTDQGTVIRISGSSRRDPAGLQKELTEIKKGFEELSG